MPRTFAIVVAVAMLAALVPLPYEYYTGLRVVTFMAGCFCGFSLINENRPVAIGLFICAAVFNPFIPAHLTREIWSVLNVIGAGVFGYAAYSINKIEA